MQGPDQCRCDEYVFSCVSPKVQGKVVIYILLYEASLFIQGCKNCSAFYIPVFGKTAVTFLSDCCHFSLRLRVKADSAAPASVTFFHESWSMSFMCVALKTRLLLYIFSEGANALQVLLVLFSVITLVKCKSCIIFFKLVY